MEKDETYLGFLDYNLRLAATIPFDLMPIYVVLLFHWRNLRRASDFVPVSQYDAVDLESEMKEVSREGSIFTNCDQRRSTGARSSPIE